MDYEITNHNHKTEEDSNITKTIDLECDSLSRDDNNKLMVDSSKASHVRKFIWDDVLENDTYFVKIDENVADNAIVPPSTYDMIHIKEKVLMLKKEFQLRSEKVEELKSILARKKLILTVQTDKIVKLWEARIRDQEETFSKTRLEKETFLKQIETDCIGIGETINEFQSRLNQEISNRGNKLGEVKNKCYSYVNDLQNKWKKEEEINLKKASCKNSKTLKNEAAKALENELKSIIEKHNENKSKIRIDLQQELELFKNKVNLENTNRLIQMKQQVDDENQSILDDLEHKFRTRLIDLEQNQNAQIENMQAALKKELEEAHHLFHDIQTNKRKEDQVEISNLENQLKNKVEAARRIQKEEIEFEEKQQKEELTLLEFQLKSEISCWVNERESELRKDFDVRRKEAIEHLSEIARNEIAMVEQRLKLELNSTTEKILANRSDELKIMNRNHDYDLAQEIKILQNLENQYKTQEDEVKTTTEQLDELRSLSRTTKNALSEALHDLEEQQAVLNQLRDYNPEYDKMQRDEFQNMMKVTADKLEQKKKDLSRISSEHKCMLAASQLDIDGLVEGYKREMDSARSKIKLIVQRKKSKINDLRKSCDTLKTDHDRIECMLQNIREETFLKP